MDFSAFWLCFDLCTFSLISKLNFLRSHKNGFFHNFRYYAQFFIRMKNLHVLCVACNSEKVTDSVIGIIAWYHVSKNGFHKKKIQNDKVRHKCFLHFLMHRHVVLKKFVLQILLSNLNHHQFFRFWKILYFRRSYSQKCVFFLN
jgi:hypothetical protein